MLNFHFPKTYCSEKIMWKESSFFFTATMISLQLLLGSGGTLTSHYPRYQFSLYSKDDLLAFYLMYHQWQW